MPPEENKALVRRWLEAIDTEDVGVVDEFVAPDYLDHNPPPFPGITTGMGIAGVKQGFAYGLAAFSDFRHVVEDQVAEGDIVVTRMTAYGVHTGEFLGIPPTGKHVSMAGIAIHRVANGKLVEHWGEIDAFGLLQQLGAVPAPGKATAV